MPKWIKSAAPNDPVSAVAKRSLQARLKRVRRYLPLAAAQADEDVEHVHQLRVWTRRAGAALRMFDAFVPQRRGKWLAKQLKQIRRTAGDARDLDVLLARLATREPPADELAPLIADVTRRRRDAQPPIVELHETLASGDRLRRRVRKLVARVRWRGSEQSDEPRYGIWADAQLRDALAPFYEAAAKLDSAELDSADLEAVETATADLDDLHQFRIAGKKLRYAMELLSAAYPREFRKELYREIVALQEKLGAINDHRVAQARYLDWAECAAAAGAEDEPGDKGEYAVLLRRLADAEGASLAACHTEFSSWWSAERAADLRQRFDTMLHLRGDVT